MYVCMYVLVTQLCPTPCNSLTVARQGSLSMGFSRQEYWSGLPFSFPGDLLNPTQESNPGLLHCRQIIYRLSFQGSAGIWVGSSSNSSFVSQCLGEIYSELVRGSQMACWNQFDLLCIWNYRKLYFEIFFFRHVCLNLDNGNSFLSSEAPSSERKYLSGILNLHALKGTVARGLNSLSCGCDRRAFLSPLGAASMGNL